MGSYSRSLEDKGYEVTGDALAGHRNLLERVVPPLRELSQLTSDLYRGGAIDNAECEALNAAIAILRDLSIPLSLLKEVDGPPALKLPTP